MKIKTIIAISVAALLMACGPKSKPNPSEKASTTAAVALPTGLEYDSKGVIAAIEGQTLTLDHEGASGAQLAAGRATFTTYADVLAEAPLTPGARVSFTFRKVAGGYELTELKGR